MDRERLWRDIEQLALRDPTVRVCLDHHRYTPGVTREGALMLMVVSLVETTKALQARLIEEISRQPPRYLIVRPEFKDDQH